MTSLVEVARRKGELSTASAVKPIGYGYRLCVKTIQYFLSKKYKIYVNQNRESEDFDPIHRLLTDGRTDSGLSYVFHFTLLG